MNRHQQLWLVVLLIMLAGGCSRRSRFGQCVFKAPDKLIKLDIPAPPGVIEIAKRHGDRDALLFLTDAHDEQHRIDAIRIDLRTGRQSADSMTYDADGRTPSPGYVQFHSAFSLDPLFVTKTIRFAYAGRTGKIFYPARSMEGRWSIESDERFSGTRKIMLGDRVLVEQAIGNYTPHMPIDSYVAIEPDGDRVVCLCSDTDNWLGIFSRKKLQSAQGNHK